MPFRELGDLCSDFVKQTAEDVLSLRWFWQAGCESSFTAPDHMSACSSCNRLFLRSDVRRGTCDHCPRKKYRDLMRVKRSMDLSERLCPVCPRHLRPSAVMPVAAAVSAGRGGSRQGGAAGRGQALMILDMPGGGQVALQSHVCFGNRIDGTLNQASEISKYCRPPPTKIRLT